jgi:hypothetical protein
MSIGDINMRIELYNKKYGNDLSDFINRSINIKSSVKIVESLMPYLESNIDFKIRVEILKIIKEQLEILMDNTKQLFNSH